jgi:hypothetical protein
MIPDSLDEFVASLSSVPWFSRIGNAPADVPHIASWDKWAGPEDDFVITVATDQQAIYDAFCVTSNRLPPELQSTWDSVHQCVFDRATLLVPYDPDEDAWHPPTAAVWDAAWTACLVALHIQTGRPVPQLLAVRWKWFLGGHWPCSYTDSPEDNVVPGFVIF